MLSFFKKWLPVTGLMLALSACGDTGHGFKGRYQADVDDDIMRNVVNLMGFNNLEIGEDYIEIKGKRTTLDRIFVRESGDKRYLVFQHEGKEDAWTIKDKQTLVNSIGVNFVRE